MTQKSQEDDTDIACAECGYYVDDMAMCASVEGLTHKTGYKRCFACDGGVDPEGDPCLSCMGTGLLKTRC